jgi:HEAT repeat protein
MPDLQSILGSLTSGDDQRAEAAIKEIAALGSDAVPLLRRLLSSSEPDSRWWAVRALAEIPSPETPSLLLEALNDPDISVSQCAALALRRQPIPQAIPDLIATLDHPDRLLAHLAADALIAQGEAAVPDLLDALENGPPPVRLEAVRALALIEDQRAIPALFKILDEDSALLEYWAETGLDRMGVGMIFFKPD